MANCGQYPSHQPPTRTSCCASSAYASPSRNDASQRANQLQNCTSSNLGAIIVNPVDPDAASNSVKAADKARIPVIAGGRGVIAEDNVACFSG